MKLSEALMLGSMSGEQPHNGEDWDCCLLGVACHAIGKRGMRFGLEGASVRWPWLNKTVYSRHVPFTAEDGFHFLTYLCGQIEDGNMTIQRAAEIVREIEPAEVELSASETNGECSLGTGPKRLQPEVVRA